LGRAQCIHRDAITCYLEAADYPIDQIANTRPIFRQKQL
jgi:hypothetical protein